MIDEKNKQLFYRYSLYGILSLFYKLEYISVFMNLYICMQRDVTIQEMYSKLLAWYGRVHHCVSLVSPSFFLVSPSISQLSLQLGWGHVTSSGQWTVSKMGNLRNNVPSASLYSLPWKARRRQVPDVIAITLRKTANPH